MQGAAQGAVEAAVGAVRLLPTVSQLFPAHWAKTCSKTGSQHQKPQKVRFWSLLKRKWKVSKARKIINNSLAQFWRNHSNGICKQQVTMELCARQQHRVTMTQPLQWDLQAVRRKRPKNYARNSDAEQHWCSPSTAICKHQSAEASRINYVGKTEAPGQDLLQNWILAPKAEKSAILKPFEKGHLEGKRKAPKTKKQ